MNRLTWDKDGYTQRVRVYWNLHKKCYSVQDCKTGRVVTHMKGFTLADAKFVVRQGGRQRVLREGKKNVHAFVTGRISLNNGVATIFKGAEKVTYNPYKNDTFVFKDTGEPVTEAHVISVFTKDGRPAVYARMT